MEKRALKISAIVLGGLIVCLLIAFIIIFSLGYRFTSTGAAGPVLADNPVIRTDEYDFYCINYDMVENNEKIGEVIIDICPVRKFGPLNKAVEFDYSPVMLRDGAVVGNLAAFQGEDRYYNFFFRYILQDELLYYYDSITIDGVEQDIYNYSYFETAEPVTEFSLENKDLIVVDDL